VAPPRATNQVVVAGKSCRVSGPLFGRHCISGSLRGHFLLWAKKGFGNTLFLVDIMFSRNLSTGWNRVGVESLADESPGTLRARFNAGQMKGTLTHLIWPSLRAEKRSGNRRSPILIVVVLAHRFLRGGAKQNAAQNAERKSGLK